MEATELAWVGARRQFLSAWGLGRGWLCGSRGLLRSSGFGELFFWKEACAWMPSTMISNHMELDHRRRGRPSPELLNPISFIALLLISGVMFLLLSAIFDFDRGRVLFSMGRPEYARGMITYLFTVVTIGTAILLIISALLGGDKEHFDRGKEVLGLLLGVFGTMVGFYFGSEQSAARTRLVLSPPLLSASEAVAGGQLSVTALVQGGNPPYHFGVVIGDKLPPKYDQVPRNDGWIVTQITVPAVSTEEFITISLGVTDNHGDKVLMQAAFTAKPRPK